MEKRIRGLDSAFRIPHSAFETDIAALSITALKGVGPKLKDKLARLGLDTVQDVLFDLPFRYQDRTRLRPIGGLVPGQEAVVVAQVELADIVYRGRRSLVVRVADGTGHLILRFFHFSAAQKENLTRGRTLKLFGEAREGPMGLEIVHPEYELIGEGASPKADEHLTPVYPATTGLHQLSLRKLTQKALDGYLEHIPEWLPQEILAPLKLPTLQEALAYVHRPPPGAPVQALEAGTHPAQQRLAFEEMLAFHLSLKRLRARMQRHAAPKLDGAGKLTQALLHSLPFAPTGAQRRVIGEIARDLGQPYPMQRLVQGDVGSGKTLVAAAACLTAIESGFQAAVMAPTELLAEQHRHNFTRWLASLGIEAALLSGKLNARSRRAALAGVREGRARLPGGTHPPFQGEGEIQKLGLIVVDEQHRFGVHQRLLL